MSDSYDLGCRDCKKSLWIGQSQNTNPPFCFYYGEEHTMKALRLFLWDHRGHSLVMDDSQVLEYEGINRDKEKDQA